MTAIIRTEMVELSEEALSQVFGGCGPVIGPSRCQPVFGPTGGGPVIGPSGRQPVFGPTGGGPVIGPSGRQPVFGPG